MWISKKKWNILCSKDSITVKEWIDITKECDKYMETVILREVGE